MKFKIKCNDISQVGLHTATLTGMLKSNPSVKKSVTFTLDIKDPCLSTQLIAPTLTDMTYKILDVQNTQLVLFKDTVSEAHRQASDINLCGDYDYAISVSVQSPHTGTLTSSDLSIDSNNYLVVSLIDQSKIGVYSVTVTASLIKSSSIQDQASF